MNSKGQIRIFCILLLCGSLSVSARAGEPLERASSPALPLSEVSPAAKSTEEQASTQRSLQKAPCDEELNRLAISLAKGIQERERLRPQEGNASLQEFLHSLCNEGVVRNGTTLHGRRDILLHFIGGIQLGLLFSEETALFLARAKELSDIGSVKGKRASGFDYNDLSASAFGVKMSLYLSTVDVHSQKNLLSQVASGRLPLSTFCPVTELPHLPAGVSPAPEQEAEYLQNLAEEWKGTLSQVAAVLRPASSGDACPRSAATIPVSLIDDRRESSGR